MSIKLGLKLWSINTDYYYDEAIKLYSENYFDYIELYAVPDTLNLIEKWKKLNIPFAIHAPHFAHNLNFSTKEQYEYNFKLVEQVKEYSESLNAIYTIFHPGIGGQLDETIKQMKEIKGLNFLVENKPFVVPKIKNNMDDYCMGARIEDIKEILNEVNCGFCLDIGHCICTANYLKQNIYEYLSKMNLLNPQVYHISDNFSDNIYDEHLHFGSGSLDIRKIVNILNDNTYLAIETTKDSKTNLDDFKQDSTYLKNIIKKEI